MGTGTDLSGKIINLHFDRLGLKRQWGTSLAVQWLRLHTPNAGGAGSIPGRGTKMPHAALRGQKKKQKDSGMFVERGLSGNCNTELDSSEEVRMELQIWK